MRVKIDKVFRFLNKIDEKSEFRRVKIKKETEVRDLKKEKFLVRGKVRENCRS